MPRRRTGTQSTSASTVSQIYIVLSREFHWTFHLQMHQNRGSFKLGFTCFWWWLWRSWRRSSSKWITGMTSQSSFCHRSRIQRWSSLQCCWSFHSLWTCWCSGSPTTFWCATRNIPSGTISCGQQVNASVAATAFLRKSKSSIEQRTIGHWRNTSRSRTCCHQKTIQSSKFTTDPPPHQPFQVPPQESNSETTAFRFDWLRLRLLLIVILSLVIFRGLPWHRPATVQLIKRWRM